ncbi:hypothetical protein RC52_03415 [Herbaspirillum rubrisubalbicans]|nr:hypothetical protein [Herbaspirillum rubrisubalbicans]
MGVGTTGVAAAALDAGVVLLTDAGNDASGMSTGQKISTGHNITSPCKRTVTYTGAGLPVCGDTGAAAGACDGSAGQGATAGLTAIGAGAVGESATRAGTAGVEDRVATGASVGEPVAPEACTTEAVAAVLFASGAAADLSDALLTTAAWVTTAGATSTGATVAGRGDIAITLALLLAVLGAAAVTDEVAAALFSDEIPMADSNDGLGLSSALLPEVDGPATAPATSGANAVARLVLAAASILLEMCSSSFSGVTKVMTGRRSWRFSFVVFMLFSLSKVQQMRGARGKVLVFTAMEEATALQQQARRWSNGPFPRQITPKSQ